MPTSIRSLECSVWIAAPLSVVWDALAKPEPLGRWLLPPALGATMARDDDRLAVVIGGFMTAEVAMIESEGPPTSMVMRGLPDRQLSFAWSLVEESRGTRATVTVQGFEALPPDAVDDRIAVLDPAWEKALANLKSVVEGAGQPYPEGLVAALFGYRRHGTTRLAVERSIWVQASRERVWEAITDPEQLQQWYSPGSPWRLSGDGVGARLAVYDPGSGDDTHVEVIEAIERPRRFVTRSQAAAAEGSQLTDWVLSEEAGGTRVTITISGYESQPAAARDDGMEQNAFGFGMMLQNLRAYLDAGELPFPGGF